MEITWANRTQLKKVLDPKILQTATVRATKTASMRVRTRISSDVRAEYNVRAGDIAKAVRLRAVTRGGVTDGRLIYTGLRVPLARFGGRPKAVRVKGDGRARKRTGVTVQVKKTETRKLVQGGFLGRGPKDVRPEVFKRVGAERIPIRRLFGPAIPQMVANPEIIRGASAFGGEVLQREWIRQVELLMSQAR